MPLLELVVPSVLSAIAGEITKSIAEHIRGKKPTAVDIKTFQRNIEIALKQTLSQFGEQVDARFIYSEERIALLEHSIRALTVTVGEINSRVGFDLPQKNSKKLLLAPDSNISDEDIFALANQNARRAFGDSLSMHKNAEINNTVVPSNPKQQRIQDLGNRAVACGMKFTLTDLSDATLDRIEAEIIGREKTLKMYMEANS